MQPNLTNIPKNMLIALSGLLMMAAASTASADVASTYARTCGTCHDTGALNAPKRGDTATWNRLRAQKGMDGLVRATRQGMPQMPAMGLCQSCSNEDFKNLIEYMAK